jgi:hypothetical protein
MIDDVFCLGVMINHDCIDDDDGDNDDETKEKW